MRVSEAIWRVLLERDDTQRLREMLNFGVKTAIAQHAHVLPLLKVLIETSSGRIPVQWASEGWPQRQAIIRDILNKRTDELRFDFNMETGSLIVPRMVGSAVDAAIAHRPDTLTAGELERELSTMLSYDLLGER